MHKCRLLPTLDVRRQQPALLHQLRHEAFSNWNGPPTLCRWFEVPVRTTWQSIPPPVGIEVADDVDRCADAFLRLLGGAAGRALRARRVEIDDDLIVDARDALHRGELRGLAAIGFRRHGAGQLRDAVVDVHLDVVLLHKARPIDFSSVESGVVLVVVCGAACIGT